MSINKKNMSLSVKMSLGFAVPLMMIAAIVMAIFVVANGVRNNATLAKDESIVFADIAYQMELDVVEVQQWLSDISATRAQDGLDDGFDEAEKSYQSFLSGLTKFRTMFEAENDSAALQTAEELKRAFANYYEAGKTMAKTYIEGGPEAGNKFMADFDKTAARLLDTLEPFVESQEQELADAMTSIISSTGVLRTSVLIAGVAALILGILLAWLITRSITQPFRNIFKGLKTFSTAELEKTGKTFRRVIDSLTEGSEQVASASGQVSSASQSLAEGSTEQAAGLEETSSSLEEMSSMTKQNADNAQQANTLASEARKAADTGTESMTRMNDAIQQIQKSSDETAKIIKVIDEIAFQTNLLALNAAVEAARAGEAGKGFAVVAEEVRNLAMRSAEAAKNTASMIEESVKNSRNGVDIAGEVSKVLEEIVGSIGKTTDLVSEIAAASQEQAQGIDQVNTAVAQMDKVTQQNAANAEESASASEELSAQAESMNEVVVELVALVGSSEGDSARNYKAGGTATRTHNPVTRDRGLSKTDHVFHHIAGGPAKKAKDRVAARATVAEAIPLDDDSSSKDELKEFNS